MPDLLRPKVDIAERHLDGPDMWHIGRPTEPFTRDYANVGLTEHDHEIFRVRTNPHLYDDWHVDTVDTQRAAYITAEEKKLGIALIDWDCYTCQRAVISRRDTYTESTQCPKCGW